MPQHILNLPTGKVGNISREQNIRVEESDLISSGSIRGNRSGSSLIATHLPGNIGQQSRNPILWLHRNRVSAKPSLEHKCPQQPNQLRTGPGPPQEQQQLSNRQPVKQRQPKHPHEPGVNHCGMEDDACLQVQRQKDPDDRQQKGSHQKRKTNTGSLSQQQTSQQ